MFKKLFKKKSYVTKAEVNELKDMITTLCGEIEQMNNKLNQQRTMERIETQAKINGFRTRVEECFDIIKERQIH